MLTRSDPSNFRHTILCAIIAQQNIILQDINMRRNPPGLKPQQSIFLKLIESISNGSKIIVAKGGTQMRFYAGMITNNQGVQFTFQCGLNRSIGYFLEYLLLIAMFGKNSLHVNLTGITNDNHDNSVDSIQQHLIPLLKQHYQFDNELSVKIIKRGYLPQGGGIVQISIPTVRKLKKVNLEDKGYIKRIRGICAGSKISTSILNDIKDQVKTAFLDYLPDIWIYTDYFKGDKASISSGYSLSLKAETTTGSVITFDAAYQGEKTEDFVKKTVSKFMDQINYSGVVSTNYQWFLLTLMALSQKKTSSIKLGRISPFTIQCLRILKDFFGVTFQIEQSKTDNMAIFRCLGIGFENYARIVY